MGGPGSGKPAGYGSLKGYEKTTDFFGNERLTTKTKCGGKIHIYKEKTGFRVDAGDHYQYHKTLDDAVKSIERNYK